MSSLPFSSLIIHFSADIPPITVRHSPFDGELLAIQKVDLGSITIPTGSESEGEGKEVECNLRWGPGGMIIFTGSLSSDSPVVIKVRIHFQRQIERKLSECFVCIHFTDYQAGIMPSRRQVVS